MSAISAKGGLGARVEEYGAETVAERGGAGLAQADDRVAGGSEPSRETAHLRGLAGAVQALEGDEASAWHGVKSIASRARTNA
jgi:hypothetical protein